MRTGIAVGLAAVMLLVALPGGLADHETSPDGPGECTWEPSAPDLQVADARGHDVVCVDVRDFVPYNPATVIIDPGTTVVWRNVGVLNTAHTATLTAGTGGDSFDVGVFGHAWHTFEDPGEYYYNCRINAAHTATMHGAVVVADGS